ncbi:MAG TPA: hypothetical protein VGM76_15235 [Lacipirellulaceae bacterium]
MSTTHHMPRSRLRVSAYDRISSLLVALLVMTSLVVAALLLLFFARKLISAQIAVPVKPIQFSGGGGGGGGGAGGLNLNQELEPPGIEEAPDLVDPPIQDTLNAVASAVTAHTAVLADAGMDAEAEVAHGTDFTDNRRAGRGFGVGTGSGNGIGSGTGDGIGSGAGPGFGNGNGPAEPQREVRFEPDNLLEYARFLDFFKIELGVLGQDNKIHYAYNLSHTVPSVRDGQPADEQRLYMNSARGRFAPLDRQLVGRAKLADKGRIVLQFYPAETQAILYQLERDRAQSAGKKVEEIRRTVFRVVRIKDGFEFQVDEQTYR